jgi:hypothetical protein
MRRRLVQDLVGLAQLAHFPFQRAQALLLVRSQLGAQAQATSAFPRSGNRLSYAGAEVARGLSNPIA